MQVRINPSVAKGDIFAPPSKSMAHRLLICAGLSEGRSKVGNLSFSEDISATLDCLSALGAKYCIDGNTVIIDGTSNKNFNKSALLNCRECGSTLRFMIPICMSSDGSYTMQGSETLMQRPLGIYEEIAKNQGLMYKKEGNTLTAGGVLRTGEYRIDGSVSSQFISGLLFALPMLAGDSTLCLIPPVESRPYIDMTLCALKSFGIEILTKDENTYYIKGGQKYLPANLNVEGDYSNSAFLEAFNLCGGEVAVKGLNPDSLQGDMVYREMFLKIKEGRATLDISDCPDLGPILFAMASKYHGALFTGTKRLKFKESDRAHAMAEELSKFGIHTDISENSVSVSGGLKAPSDVLCGHNDHRIVMSLAVLASVTGGVIDEAQAVRKSYPDFFERIKELGVEADIIGMD